MKTQSKRKILLELARFYGVNLIIKKMSEHATVDLIKDIIFIDFHESQPLDWILTNFFHEYAHLYCKHNNLYKLYHSDTVYLSKAQQSGFLKTMWRAEVYVDKIAAELMRIHFNGRYSYIHGYIPKTKKLILPEMQKNFKAHFETINKLTKSEKLRLDESYKKKIKS